jgi:DNA-directed RNA polymerase specialized sigma24 family protein
VDDEDVTLSVIEKNDTEDFFKRLKEELSPLEAKILTEYLHDRTYAEISDTLGVSSKTIDNSLSRIKGKMRKLYKL